MGKLFNFGNSIVIGLTFILFIAALFIKGFTHDLLLEAGVFLVSVKLILLSQKTIKMEEKILDELKEIEDKMKLKDS